MTTQNIEINFINTADNNEAQSVDEPVINYIIDQQQTIELPNEDVNDPVKESLAKIFKRNYDNYIHKNLSDRFIDTTTNKKINRNLLNTANDVMRNQLNNIDKFTLREINCTIYCIALTCKELNNDVRTSGKRKDEPRKWNFYCKQHQQNKEINIPFTSCNKMQTTVYVYKTSKDTPPHIKKEIW